MNAYLFQLGHCPDLSFAELLAVNARLSNRWGSFRRMDDAAILDRPSLESVQPLCDELGGTIRAVEIFSEISGPEESNSPVTTPDTLLNAIVSAGVDRLLMEKSKRPTFGLSLLGTPGNSKTRRDVHSLLHETACLLKERLRENGVSSRFILPDPKEAASCLSGAQVEKNGLLDEGMEIAVHYHPPEFRIGRTVWLQHYEEFSQRDYGRPERDARSGMLPPKLARILINLARVSDTKTILDPFCGSGGVVTEAAIMGLQAAGFDSSQKAVEDTRHNWNWLRSQGNHADAGWPSGEVRASIGDARQLHTLCEPLYFDACVSEPYLGPPTSRPLDADHFEALSRELVPLYLRALGEIRTVVKPGARVVFVVPRFRIQGEKKPGSLAILSEIKLQGYTLLDPLCGFQPSNGRTTLIYSRPKQVVQREIFVLKA